MKMKNTTNDFSSRILRGGQERRMEMNVVVMKKIMVTIYFHQSEGEILVAAALRRCCVSRFCQHHHHHHLPKLVGYSISIPSIPFLMLFLPFLMTMMRLLVVVVLLFEMMFDPSVLFKMTTTTVNDLVVAVAVEVTCALSFLRKTPLNAFFVRGVGGTLMLLSLSCHIFRSYPLHPTCFLVSSSQLPSLITYTGAGSCNSDYHDVLF